ncbi:MAG: hypothetical protein WBL35_13430, partial [Ornithinibacter sp.]
AATTSSATSTTSAATTSPETAKPAAQPAARSGTGDAVGGGDRIDIDIAQESPSRAPEEIVVEAAREVTGPLVDEDDIPLTWNPVPVPRPTYTMKAKAERRDPVPADVTPAGQPAERDGSTAFADRRVAGA